MMLQDQNWGYEGARRREKCAKAAERLHQRMMEMMMFVMRSTMTR